MTRSAIAWAVVNTSVSAIHMLLNAYHCIWQVAGIKAVSTTTPAQVKGTSVFDSMEKQKPGRISFSAAKSSASDTVEVAQGGKKMMKVGTSRCVV